MPIMALQEQMGHNDPRTTMGYCHAEAKSVGDPIARMRQTTLTVLPAVVNPVNRLNFTRPMEERMLA